MSRQFLTHQLLFASFLLFLAVSPANSQCRGSSLPTASLSATIVQKPPTPSGLKAAIFPSSLDGHDIKLDYKLFLSGQTISFNDNCPGKYILFIAGTGFSDCGYVTKKKIVLHEKQTRKLKLTVTWKKGALCE
ncbi:MAG TPA: hypothetical protein VJX70_09805 [Candidatus Acidoferrum sp.]|nr:hypothetical protein [Candidatus Acidoferrum sp.]